MTKRPRVLMIDNYDSFTHILGHELDVAGAEITTLRHDVALLDEALKPGWSGIVISPGPGRPEESGTSAEVVEHWTGRVPILGVCLGFQLLASMRGAQVIAKEPVHGRTSSIEHVGQGIFAGLVSPIEGARYHSLRAESNPWPSSLRVTAWAKDDRKLIMAFDDENVGWHAVQFHPESFMTTHGSALLRRFVETC